MQKARRHHSRGSDRLRAHGFRVSFTPLSAVLFTFPSRYLCAIGMVPPVSDRAPPTPPYSGYSLGWSAFKVRGCHPLRPAFPGAFPYVLFFHDGCPTTPSAP